MPVDVRVSSRGLDESAEDLDNCGFSGAVGPEEAENLALLDLEADTVQRINGLGCLSEDRAFFDDERLC